MTTIESENSAASEPAAPQPKARRKAAKKAKSAKKPAAAKKARARDTERTNKKAEVIALMKRAKGATLAEIMKATGWQPHTVRGFVAACVLQIAPSAAGTIAQTSVRITVALSIRSIV